MNIQARIDYLTEMLESAKYEYRSNRGDDAVSVLKTMQYGDIVEHLEMTIATLEYLKEL